MLMHFVNHFFKSICLSYLSTDFTKSLLLKRTCLGFIMLSIEGALIGVLMLDVCVRGGDSKSEVGGGGWTIFFLK